MIVGLDMFVYVCTTHVAKMLWMDGCTGFAFIHINTITIIHYDYRFSHFYLQLFLRGKVKR